MTAESWSTFFQRIGWSLNTDPDTSAMYVGSSNHPMYGNLRARLEITPDIDNYNVLRGHAFARSALGALHDHDDPLLLVGTGIMMRTNDASGRSYGVIGFLVYMFNGSICVDEFSAVAYCHSYLPRFGSNRVFTGWNWNGHAENIPNPPGCDSPLLGERPCMYV